MCVRAVIDRCVCGGAVNDRLTEMIDFETSSIKVDSNRQHDIKRSSIAVCMRAVIDRCV